MEKNNDHCPSCLEVFDSGLEGRLLTCGHSFCHDCYDKWALGGSWRDGADKGEDLVKGLMWLVRSDDSSLVQACVRALLRGHHSNALPVRRMVENTNRMGERLLDVIARMKEHVRWQKVGLGTPPYCNI